MVDLTFVEIDDLCDSARTWGVTIFIAVKKSIHPPGLDNGLLMRRS